jgi:hypothetical protein
MNEVALNGDKRMTLRQIAAITGAAYSTVAAYAQKAGWTVNGEKTLLDERQTTIIIEAMKQGETGAAMHKREEGSTFHNVIEAVSTDLTPAIQLKILAEKREELHRQELDILNAEIARVSQEKQREINAIRGELTATKKLLEYRTSGLETIQRIAESGGLVLSDKDDLYSAYRGKS